MALNRRGQVGKSGRTLVRLAAVRRGLLALCVLIALLVSSAQYALEPVPLARAQEPAETAQPTADPTGTATPQPTASAGPVPTATPSPTRTGGGPAAIATDTSIPAPSITPTTTPGASVTPVPTPALPTLEPNPDPSDTVAQGTVTEAGGRVSTADGRVVIDFPPGAALDPLNVSITREALQSVLPPSPDNPFVGLWRFDATDDRGSDLHKFDAALNVTLRFDDKELRGRDPQTLTYWSFDENSQTWVPAPAVVDARTKTLTARVDHFSLSGATASPIVDTAPLLSGSHVGTQTGSASFNVPLAAPPGRNGVAPQLNLSYDSMRVGEMRTYSSLSGWAGMGWELGTGSVQVSYEPTGDRYFLEGQGFGGEMMQDGTESILYAHEKNRSRIAGLNETTWFSTGSTALEQSVEYMNVEAIGPYLFRIAWFNVATAYHAVGPYLQRSVDRGLSWVDVGPPPQTDSSGQEGGAWMVAEAADGSIYLAAGNPQLSEAANAMPARLYKSVDDGVTFSLILEVDERSATDDMVSVESVMTHPTDPNVVVLEAELFAEGMLFFHTDDAGETFARTLSTIEDGWYPTRGYVGLLHDGRMVALDGTHISYSFDYGVTVTWAKWPDNATDAVVGDGWPPSIRTGELEVGPDGVAFLIHAGGVGEVWRTTNLGQNWERIYEVSGAEATSASAEYDAKSDTLYLRNRWGYDPLVLALPSAATASAPIASVDASDNLEEALDGLSSSALGDDGMAITAAARVWRLREQPYLRVRSDCLDASCPFFVTDQSGTLYVYGTDDAHRRWYIEYVGGEWVRRYYRLDLTYVVDRLGNRVDYTYWQQRYDDPNCGSGPECEYVLAAYPEDILYNYNGVQARANVHFNLGWDNDNDAFGREPEVLVRNDTPYNVTPGGCGNGYEAPKVLEIRKLDSVEMRVYDDDQWKLARRYDLSYTTAPFSTDTACPPQPFTGNNTLDTIALKGTDGTSALYEMTFEHEPEHHAFMNGASEAFGYDWAHLTEINNGFGGTITFDYYDESLDNGCACLHWSRNAVQSETASPGAGQPSIVTTYSYVGPFEWDYPDPYQPSNSDPFNAENRGYSDVTETDADGNQVIHKYFVASDLGDWDDELRHGREYETIVRDSVGAQWHKTVTTWSIRPVANESGGRYYVNFIHPAGTTTTLRDGTALSATNEYDAGQTCPIASTTTCFGLLTRADDLGVTGTGDDVTTKTGYHKNEVAWLFVPRFQEVIDPVTGELLGCSRTYYDGANTVATAPARGLVTTASTALDATATQCESEGQLPSSANTYLLYDTYGSEPLTYGNVVAQSLVEEDAPESHGIGSEPDPGQFGWGFGWVNGWYPGSGEGEGFSLTTYDGEHHLYPVSQKNPVEHVATTSYDFVLGKPLTVTGPFVPPTSPTDEGVGFAEMRYDVFGRLTMAWDNLDSETVPTSEFTYAWGTVPNRTTAATRVEHGEATTRKITTCTDGLGRTVETRSHFFGDWYNSVRTDYDGRGMQQSVSNPVLGGQGASIDCAAMLDPIGGRDRVTSEYDTLGNVVRATSLETGGVLWALLDCRLQRRDHDVRRRTWEHHAGGPEHRGPFARGVGASRHIADGLPLRQGGAPHDRDRRAGQRDVYDVRPGRP
ncbi:MAG: SpvB/TcaC N-terminal domain-containing protein [Dehalococcoidia bacterium]